MPLLYTFPLYIYIKILSTYLPSFQKLITLPSIIICLKTFQLILFQDPSVQAATANTGKTASLDNYDPFGKQQQTTTAAEPPPAAAGRYQYIRVNGNDYLPLP